MVEAARANDELSSTRKALLDIQCNIAVVQKAMQQDQQDQEQAARAEELEGKVEEAGQKLAHTLLRQEQVDLAMGIQLRRRQYGRGRGAKGGDRSCRSGGGSWVAAGVQCAGLHGCGLSIV